MTLEMDSDLKAVLEYMQTNVPAAKLVGVARELAIAAPVLWGRYDADPVIAMTLRTTLISRDDPRTRLGANE